MVSLKRSIDVGLNMERAFLSKSLPSSEHVMVPDTAFAEPAVEITSVRVPSRSWYRIAGRFALRALRPFAAPLLNRLDHRIRWALDRSDLAARLGEVDHKTGNAAENIVALLNHLAARLGEVDHKTDNKAENIMALLNHLAARLGEVEHKTDNAAQNIGTMRDDLARGSIRIEQMFSASDGLLQDRIEGLDRTNAQRLIPLQTAAEKLNVQSDLLVQRNIIHLGQELAVRTAAGYLLAPVEDPAVLIGLVEGRGFLEPGTTAVLQTLLRPGDIMVDVGGHIGTLTLPAARRVGATGRVIALEPAPRLADLLRRTIVLNHIVWVDVHECAAGAAEEMAQFAISAKTGHNSLFPINDTVQQIEVLVRPLDALIPPQTKVHVVKVDAEGAELQVWRGMQRILADNPAVAVILEFGPEHLVRVDVTIAEWFAEVTAHGHTPWEIDEQTGRVRPLRTTGLEDVFSLNVLLLRDAPIDRGLLLA